MNFFKKCDVTCSWTPSLCHKLLHLLGPHPLERDVLYGRPRTDRFPPNILDKSTPVNMSLSEALPTTSLIYSVGVNTPKRCRQLRVKDLTSPCVAARVGFEPANHTGTHTRTRRLVDNKVCTRTQASNLTCHMTGYHHHHHHQVDKGTSLGLLQILYLGQLQNDLEA